MKVIQSCAHPLHCRAATGLTRFATLFPTVRIRMQGQNMFCCNRNLCVCRWWWVYVVSEHGRGRLICKTQRVHGKFTKVQLTPSETTLLYLFKCGLWLLAMIIPKDHRARLFCCPTHIPCQLCRPCVYAVARVWYYFVYGYSETHQTRQQNEVATHNFFDLAHNYVINYSAVLLCSFSTWTKYSLRPQLRDGRHCFMAMVGPWLLSKPKKGASSLSFE